MDAKFRAFNDEISLAVMGRRDHVEADEDIIKYFNPQGLGGADYFMYKSVKVIRKGKVDEVNRKLKASIAVNQQYTGITIEGTHE
jgi:hypothetical protein